MALLDASVIPAELQQPILDRAGGNPLYAEEFVRLLKDKDLLVRKGSTWELREGVEVPFPDSVRALIAARLDTLTPDAKSLLADAAVIGKVFWVGGVARMGERDLDWVASVLRDLSRKELVRASRHSSMQGEAEYAFWHILTRDVAYNQLPRASRAARHTAAATWIEAQAPDRAEDHADLLAYHYATALTSLTPRARQTRQPRWKTPPDASSRSPENAPSDSTRQRQSPTSSGHSNSPPLATLTDHTFSSASPRPPNTPTDTATRRRRSRRRSPPSTHAATCQPKPTH